MLSEGPNSALTISRVIRRFDCTGDPANSAIFSGEAGSSDPSSGLNNPLVTQQLPMKRAYEADREPAPSKRLRLDATGVLVGLAAGSLATYVGLAFADL